MIVVPINYALKGKEYTEVEFTVTREGVERFCDAIGEAAPACRDPEAARALGYPEQVAPPTFVTTMQVMTTGQAIVDPELGLNFAMVVHGEQAYEYRRPVVVGDVLRTVPRIADVFAKGRNEFLVIESEIRDASGETVVVARSTLLSRGTAERG